jgi:predicted RNA-binding protein YlxR (DUF448 family)/ribosomal protein L7Ae-like RNA K-turn-binding protein
MSGASPHELTEALDLEEKGPLRRCIVSGDSKPRETMLRFVVGPDQTLVPDLAEKLPGRGLWLTPDHKTLAQAIEKRVFARAARQQVKIPADFPQLLAGLFRQRLCDQLGMARRAGAAVAGFEKVDEQIRRGRIKLLLIAADAGKDGRRQLENLAPGTKIIDVLDSAALAGIFGAIGVVVYAGISDKAHAAKLTLTADRLAALSVDVE